MIRRILISTTALSALSFGAFAQTNTTNIVREAVPEQHQPIIANSPQDLALQEEIRRIRAYNAQVAARVGISDAYTQTAPTPANPYQGRKVELFATPTTITYTTASGRRVGVVPTTITERKPTIGYTRIHRIVTGDTLYSLATRNCISVANIKNHNALTSSNIQLGQVLTLPASKCGAKTLAATSTNQVRSETITKSGIVRRVMPIQTGIQVGPRDVYAVLPKDTLYSIGKRYCVKADALAQFNGLNSKTAIQPGQRLRLPGNACIK
ncbi:MAG: LysM peptidoglycan-binding domain-containing protein [Robiginitomaculum sp.]|nr:LysM peptidoglycan-binding domain-containing protein [Robiginitomaculum sp.]